MSEPEVKQKVIDSPSKFSVYSNSTEFGLSPWDVRMIIKEMTGPPVDNEAVIIHHGTIVMSPAHAKVFLGALQRTMTMYEEKFGEIDVSKIKETLLIP